MDSISPDTLAEFMDDVFCFIFVDDKEEFEEKQINKQVKTTEMKPIGKYSF